MFRSSTILAAFLASTALGTGAVQAADLPLPPAEVVPVLSWTGFYVGIEGGGGAINHETDFFDGGLVIDGFSGEGWQLGGVVGFDWQLPNAPFVLGVLADGHWSNIETEATLLGIVNASLESQWGFDVLGRAGWLVTPRALWYVLGGYSHEEFEGEVEIPLAGFELSDTEDADGWTIGTGIEVRLTDTLSIKGEYRYTQFDSFDFDTGGAVDIESSRHVALMGVNYKLGGLFGGAAGASYAQYDPVVFDGAGWTGFYVGIGGGGGIIDYDTEVLGGVLGIDGFGAEGGLVEGTVGFDYQINTFVLGALADGHWSNFEVEATTPILGGITASLESQWGFDVLGRGGVLTSDRTLLYALLGYSFEEFEGNVSFPAAAIDLTDDEEASGWTIGGGIEVLATPNISVKGEYRFTGFEDFDFDTGGILTMEGNRHTGRIGVNYRFGNLFAAN
jgi:outer membrane immunogenic protein